MKSPHPHVEFATRHSKSPHSTLTAFAAISRVENLLYDIEELDALIRKSEAAGESAGRRYFWFEIISYYTVGFVTCLEWHARSRLIDLFVFNPTCIRAGDVGQLNDKTLSQMVAQGVTVPQLLGAMMSVGSSQRYFSVFERLFSELGLEPNPRTLVNPIILRDGLDPAKMHDALQSVFDYRNTIVHEIDYSMIGPYLVRGNLNIAEARAHGELVLAIMKALEKCISEKAPKDFPNLLDEEGLPRDEVDELDQKIATIEQEITDSIRNLRSLHQVSSPGIDDWVETISHSRANTIKETEFIAAADFLHNRHIDLRTPLLIAIRRLRLEYLQILRSQL
jgi:polyhydroxyalkanoate synthesis regulator phasin